MRLWLLRHATLQVHASGLRLLVDPQLDPAGARPPAGSPGAPRNPLVDLPEPAEVAVQHLDAVLVTCLHSDHLDATALRLLPRELPVLCQPADADALRERGFADVRAVAEHVELGPLRVARTGGCHGSGAAGEGLGPVSGFVIAASGEPVLYLTGDTIGCDAITEALAEHTPDVVVVNAGAARLADGDRITMDADDVVAVARQAPYARVVAVHMDAVDHCPLTRADLHQRIHDEGLADRVTVPEDGAEIPLP